MVLFNESLEDINNYNYFNNNNYGFKRKTKISKLLYKLSHYGLNYDDDVLKNMQAIPEDTHLSSRFDQMSMYGNDYKNFMSQWNNPQEENSFNLKTIEEKRNILRRMAMQPELEDIIDIVCNEAIVYNDDTYICEPYIENEIIDDLLQNRSNEIKMALVSNFYKIYSLLEWKKKAWNVFRKWLIDGVMAYEIVYDDLLTPKNIVGIFEIDPGTLTKVVTEDNTTTWIQNKGQTNKERILLDSQIIYIKYEDSGVSTRQSYLERLIRPFNLYRIVEQAQVIWTVSQSSFKTVFTIPIREMNRAKGMQTLNAAMNRYKEDISFNTETAELLVNGKMNMPFNKEYFMPENEAGAPKIETLADGGPVLADNDQLNRFENKLYKVSKVPPSRFNSEDRATWFGTDPSQMLRDEINFSRFIKRLRNEFAQIIVKPLQIQMLLVMPDLNGDKRITDAINIKFNSYNQFEELMEADLDEKRAQVIQSISSGLMEDIGDGTQECYLSMGFLVKKYMNLSEADIEENKKFKEEDKIRRKERQREQLALQQQQQNISNDMGMGAGGDMGMGAGGDMGMGAGGDMGLGAPANNPTGEPMGNETPGFDSEMSGEVEQEPAETIQNNG